MRLEVGSLTRHRRGVGDPSLRLKNGCAQDDAAEMGHRALVAMRLEVGSLTRHRRGVGDPSLRLKNGCAQDDAVEMGRRAALRMTPPRWDIEPRCVARSFAISPGA